MEHVLKIIKFLFGIIKFILMLIGALVVLYIFIIGFDGKDACYDSGYCKEGLELMTENGKITINEQTCIQNDGVWKIDRKVCQFKDW